MCGLKFADVGWFVVGHELSIEHDLIYQSHWRQLWRTEAAKQEGVVNSYYNTNNAMKMRQHDIMWGACLTINRSEQSLGI